MGELIAVPGCVHVETGEGWNRFEFEGCVTLQLNLIENIKGYGNTLQSCSSRVETIPIESFLPRSEKC